jgi:hypothetical protein
MAAAEDRIAAVAVFAGQGPPGAAPAVLHPLVSRRRQPENRLGT